MRFAHWCLKLLSLFVQVVVSAAQQGTQEIQNCLLPWWSQCHQSWPQFPLSTQWFCSFLPQEEVGPLFATVTNSRKYNVINYSLINTTSASCIAYGSRPPMYLVVDGIHAYNRTTAQVAENQDQHEHHWKYLMRQQLATCARASRSSVVHTYLCAGWCKAI